MEKNLGLGKGLSALMGEDAVAEVPVNQELKISGITLIDIEKLSPSALQPRRIFKEDALIDLVNSIRERGVLQPLLARPNPQRHGTFEIIAGERRYRASKIAGLEQVPVIIKDFDDKTALEVALIENLQREDLNPLEEAEAYKRLLEEFRYTQEELAQVVGKSRSHLANMMRLLELPASIKGFLESRDLTVGHARALLNVPKAEELARHVIQKGLSVRQTEKLVSCGGVVSKGRVKSDKGNDILALEKELSHMLKTPVIINWRGSGRARGSCGEVIIRYDSVEKLDLILQRLSETK